MLFSVVKGVRVSPGPRCSRSTSRSSGGGDSDPRPASTSASDSEDLPPPPYLSPDVVSISVADPDPGSGAFLNPGSGIRNGQPGSYFRELRNIFFAVKILKFLNADP